MGESIGAQALRFEKGGGGGIQMKVRNQLQYSVTSHLAGVIQVQEHRPAVARTGNVQGAFAAVDHALVEAPAVGSPKAGPLAGHLAVEGDERGQHIFSS